MAFLSGPECSTAANPLNQFMKHAQDDRSLQRDRLVGRGPSGLQQGMRSNMHAPGAADAMMDEFMQQNAQMGSISAPSAVEMERMRRDFEALLHTAPQQRNGSSAHWAAEFEPAIDDNVRMEAAFPVSYTHLTLPTKRIV